MKSYIKFLSILSLLIILSLGAVSASGDVAVENDGSSDVAVASIANVYVVTEDNYDDYFGSTGLLSPVNNGDTVKLSGNFTNKNFVIDKNITVTGDNSVINQGTVKLLSGASGSTISNLKIINKEISDKQGIFLDGASNCLLLNNDIFCSGTSSFTIALNPGSNYNVISDNILKAGNVVLGGTTKASSCMVLGSSHYNTIKNNYLEIYDANGIYFSAYGSGSFNGGKCNNNIIYNNTVKCLIIPTSWCYGIQLMGTNNIVDSNTVIGTYRGISTGGNDRIINNKVINLTGINFATGEQSGGEYAIIAGANSNITNNSIVNSFVVDAAIAAYDNTIVMDNTVEIKQGTGIGVQANANNVKVINNDISTVSGAVISQEGKYNGLVVRGNNLTSSTGIGVYATKTSRTKYPTNITITSNKISTGNAVAINAQYADENTYYINYNTIEGSSKIITPNGESVQTDDFDFTDNVYNVTPENYHTFFDENGNFININVNDGDTLNFIGEFNNIIPKLTLSLKIVGNDAVFKDSKFTITSNFVWLENLTFINNNSWAIYAEDTNKLMILNNNISVTDKSAAYAIYLYGVSNATIKNSNLYSSGDYLTYTVLGFLIEDSIIENNTILTNGSGEVHAYEPTKCIDGVHMIKEIYRTYGILLIESSNNQVNSNNVTVTSKLNTPQPKINGTFSTNSLVGIDACFDCNDNVFYGNNVWVYGNDNYMYGMGALGAQTNTGSEFSENNEFTNNCIVIDGKHMGTGLILGYHTNNNSISGNNISVSADDSAYGITLEYAKDSNVIKNNVDLKSDISYVIEMFEGDNNVISKNYLTSNGTYGMGIGGYNSNNNNIIDNTIVVNNGGEKEVNASSHVDALGVTNVGVFFVAASTENFIDSNDITTNKGYAVNITGLSNNVVTNNYLKGENVSGNKAVLGASGNTVENNQGSELILTNGTFNNFFDENGVLRDNITATGLIFVGEFANVSSNVIVINRPIYLSSDNAILNNIRFKILGNATGTVINGFTFITNLGNVAEISADNVSFINNDVNAYLAQGKDNILINASNVEAIIIKDNNISINGKTNASTINGIINLQNAGKSLAANNKINANIPSSATVYGPAPDYKPSYASYIIQVSGKDNSIVENDITFNHSCVVGSYDSMYAIVSNGANSTVSRNSIKGNGNNYIYGITADGKNVEINANNITLTSNNCANGISLNDPFEGSISNNIVNITSKSVAYGTNDYMGGDINAVYDSNKFILSSNSVYGMELMGYDETVINNEIYANGNFTMGIAAFLFEGNLNISNNKVVVNGSGLGTPTSGDVIQSANVGIYATGDIDSTVISGNEIIANIPSTSWDKNSAALISKVDNANIESNKINVTVSNRVGDYDSIYGAKISGDGVLFNNNNVSVVGKNYTYGLKVSGDGFTIDSNKINVIGENNYANGISIETPFKGIVSNNLINSTAISAAYGIVSSTWGSTTVESDYVNNSVTVDAKTSYGMELMGTTENAYNNTIIANGEYAMGIATSTPSVEIKNNYIVSNGTGKTNATTIDMFGATNEGILLFGNATGATIVGNNVTTTGKYAVNVLKNKNNISSVKNNYLLSDEFVGDLAVNNIDGNVSDNIPLPKNTLIGNDVVKYYKNGTQYTVTVLDYLGNPLPNQKVVVSLDGKSFSNLKYTIVTDSNGVATLPINLAPGNYNITAILGDESVKNTITVLPMTYSLSAKDIDMVFKDGTQYTATLVDGSGNPVCGETVSITISSSKWKNPVTYNKVTDSDGVVSLPINLAPGTYSITAKYGSQSVTTTVTVLNSAYKIESSDLIKYYKNGTQYTVSVKDLNGNAVVGKTVKISLSSPNWKSPAIYNVITDSNGVATLSINLVAGSYTVSAQVGDNIVKSSINVLPILTSEDLTKPVNQPASLSAKLVDGQGKAVSGKIVSFTVKTKTYNMKTDANGIAKLPINLAVGNWNIQITDPVSGAKTTAKVIVTKPIA